MNETYADNIQRTRSGTASSDGRHADSRQSDSQHAADKTWTGYSNRTTTAGPPTEETTRLTEGAAGHTGELGRTCTDHDAETQHSNDADPTDGTIQGCTS